MDWLIHWYLDDYIELDKKQKKSFDEQFREWMTWHRAEELEKYQHYLQKIRDLLDEESITKEQVLTHFDLGREHWVRLRTRILPDLSELAMSMSQQQIDELFASLEEKNSDQEEERLNMTQEEIATSYQEKLEDELKDFIGDLTSEQESLVKSASMRISPNRIEWIKYRRTFQAAARDLLNQRDSNPDFKVEFVKLLSKPEAFQHQSYIQNTLRNRDVFAQLVADVLATLTPKQKMRLVGEVENLIEDIIELRENAPRT